MRRDSYVSPAAGSPTTTLLRLHPSYPSRRAAGPPLRCPRVGSGLLTVTHNRYSKNNSHGVTGGVY